MEYDGTRIKNGFPPPLLFTWDGEFLGILMQLCSWDGTIVQKEGDRARHRENLLTRRKDDMNEKYFPRRQVWMERMKLNLSKTSKIGEKGGGGANGYNKVVKTYFQIHVAGEQLHIYMKQISQ